MKTTVQIYSQCTCINLPERTEEGFECPRYYDRLNDVTHCLVPKSKLVNCTNSELNWIVNNGYRFVVKEGREGAIEFPEWHENRELP